MARVYQKATKTDQNRPFSYKTGPKKHDFRVKNAIFLTKMACFVVKKNAPESAIFGILC
jgi:hypothetical protein